VLLTNSRFYCVVEKHDRTQEIHLTGHIVQIKVINYIRSVVLGMTLVARQYTARNLQNTQFMHTASNSEKNNSLSSPELAQSAESALNITKL